MRVLLDGFGALSLPRQHFDSLRDAGAEVAVFRPIFSLRRIGPRNLRNHRKLTIADDGWLWSGGRNLAGEYFTGNDKHPDGLARPVVRPAWQRGRGGGAPVRPRLGLGAQPQGRAPSRADDVPAGRRAWRSSCRAAPTRPKTRRTHC